MNGTGLLSRLSLAFASVAAVLILAEFAVRLLDIGPTFYVVFQEIFQISSNPVLGYELRPGAVAGHASINSAGFRDREFASDKPQGVFRIAAAGDSVTFGYGLGQGASYPKQLEALLNREAKPGVSRFEVLNLGVSGYNIVQAVERLGSLGLRFDPDLLLYGYVLNDPQDISREGEIIRSLSDFEEGRFAADLVRGGNRLLSRSRLFLMSRQLLRGQLGQDRSFELSRGRLREAGEGGETLPILPQNDPGFLAFHRGDTRGRYFRTLHADPSSRERQTRGLANLAALAGAAEVPALVVIFPLFLQQGFEGYPLADLHEEVSKQARENGLQVLDLLPSYQRAEEHSPGSLSLDDWLHPNPSGHAVAAAAIERWLREAGALPR